MKPCLTLLNQVTFIPALWMTAACGTLIYHGVVSCRIVRKRRKARDYNRFVEFHYTKNGKPTPALILRIQNAYIQDYNQALHSWAGKLFRFKAEPLYDNPDGEGIPVTRSMKRLHERIPARR